VGFSAILQFYANARHLPCYLSIMPLVLARFLLVASRPRPARALRCVASVHLFCESRNCAGWARTVIIRGASYWSCCRSGYYS